MMLPGLGAGKLFGWGLIPSHPEGTSDAFWEVLREAEEEKYLLLAVRNEREIVGRNECWLHTLSVQAGNWWPFEFVQLHYEDNCKVLFVVMG